VQNKSVISLSLSLSHTHTQGAKQKLVKKKKKEKGKRILVVRKLHGRVKRRECEQVNQLAHGHTT